MAGQRREAGVEIVRYGRDAHDRNPLARLAQMRVERVAHRVGPPVPAEIDMRDLTGSVDAGVGAARTAQRDRLAAEFFDRLLDRRLHGRLVGLPLPAGIGAAVILDVEAKAWHGASDRQAASAVPKAAA